MIWVICNLEYSTWRWYQWFFSELTSSRRAVYTSLPPFSLVPCRFPIYNDMLHSATLLLSQNAVLFMRVRGCSYNSLYAPQRQGLFRLFLCISWNLLLLFGLQQSFNKYCWLIGWPSGERECKTKGTGIAQEDSGKQTWFPCFFLMTKVEIIKGDPLCEVDSSRADHPVISSSLVSVPESLFFRLQPGTQHWANGLPQSSLTHGQHTHTHTHTHNWLKKKWPN